MMLRLVVIIGLLSLVACTTLSSRGPQGNTEATSPGVSEPLWTMGSLNDPIANHPQAQGRSEDPLVERGKIVSPGIGKPQGPLQVQYLLEHWGQDDYRLIVEVESQMPLSAWSIAIEALDQQSRFPIKARELALAKADSGSRAFQDRRYYQLGSLAGVDRLLVTAETELLGRAVSKTVSVRLKERSIAPRICKDNEGVCTKVLPAETTVL